MLPVEGRNLAHYFFLNPAARDLYADWPETGREIVGMLHLQESRLHTTPVVPVDRRAIVRRPGFSSLVGRPGCLHAPPWLEALPSSRAGDLILGYESFTPIGDPDQTLGLYTVESGSPSERALSRPALSADRPGSGRGGNPGESGVRRGRSWSSGWDDYVLGVGHVVVACLVSGSIHRK